MAKKQKRRPWRAKGKGSLRLRKGACVATIEKGGSWSVTDGRVERGGWGKSPTEAKRRAKAALNTCQRDYDAMAEEHAYQGRHEGGFAGLGFIKRLFGRETPDELAKGLLKDARHAYEESMIAASQERCPAAHKFLTKGGDYYLRAPGKGQVSAEVKELHDETYALSDKAHEALRRFCR